jgi:hypothetical protein
MAVPNLSSPILGGKCENFGKQHTKHRKTNSLLKLLHSEALRRWTYEKSYSARFVRNMMGGGGLSLKQQAFQQQNLISITYFLIVSLEKKISPCGDRGIRIVPP